MPKISTNYSAQVRSCLIHERNRDPNSIDAITYLTFIAPVTEVTYSIEKRINSEVIPSVNEISKYLQRNSYTKKQIYEFRRNVKIITDYYIRGIYAIEKRIIKFAEHNSCSRARTNKLAINLRIKSIAEAELLYEDAHLQLGTLHTCSLEAQLNLSSPFLPSVVESCKTFALTIIKDKLTWHPTGKYPLCARVLGIDLWPTKPRPNEIL